MSPFAIPHRLLPAAIRALDEGRLWYRVGDAQGRPCNGGSADPLPIGKWSPVVASPVMCLRGWHVTREPDRWAGSRVWVVEVADLDGGLDEGKGCASRIRPLCEVDPRACLDASARVRCGSGALWLARADLRGADLRGATLRGANLAGANLAWADLRGANLAGADLAGANLAGANLAGANLAGADLARADLSGATLRGANLAGADLARADLSEANLARANLGGWERGPDGFARRVSS